eukprot:CAMPEP_0197935098 /NCGR_PEP_ID=MMETSP1439-20131203/112779_1 /TAXON_ID=66791 /ORGANISM="Gonyaulax spinifera, Strain CCMP409" /LENGTH=78 /DNA_ID=CAMNT_0043558021 /DNA_START=125 /DNA_END=358 /DNA_ORIENTATION=+
MSRRRTAGGSPGASRSRPRTGSEGATALVLPTRRTDGSALSRAAVRDVFGSAGHRRRLQAESVPAIGAPSRVCKTVEP